MAKTLTFLRNYYVIIIVIHKRGHSAGELQKIGTYGCAFDCINATNVWKNVHGNKNINYNRNFLKFLDNVLGKKSLAEIITQMSFQIDSMYALSNWLESDFVGFDWLKTIIQRASIWNPGLDIRNALRDIDNSWKITRPWFYLRITSWKSRIIEGHFISISSEFSGI